MDFRALGPLTVEIDTVPLKLGGPRQRMVLATLLCRANHTVSQDALIEAVWAGDPPEAARSTLQGYVYGLRQALGSEAIIRHGDGYRVEVDAGSFDVLAFEQLVERGRRLLEDEPSTARSVLVDALGLWFGSPYGGLDDNPVLIGETARLGELRLVAVEARIDAELAVGNHAAVVGELETLIREHPLRERFRGQHMMALYRSGRQAEALRAYQQARTLLVEELGIEPSVELRDLEQRILDQDPGLRPDGVGETVHRAFLFTDVEDSTLLWDVHTEHAQAAIDRQDDVVCRATVDNGGTVFKRTGDGLYAQFERAEDAIAAAVSAQERLAGTDWGDMPDVRVRMAVVSGEVERRGSDFSGPLLHRAARVLALGHGGQVLVTEEVATSLGALDTKPLGEQRLRGMALPETLYQLVVPGLRREFPPLRIDRSPVLDVEGDGRTVRGYELRQPLGRGDFGLVYRAFQPSLGREVAVKVIRPEYANRLAFVRRFEREAQIVAQLEHPNILPLFDFWRDPDGAFLVMPVMRGGSLANALTRGGWNLAPALHLLDQVGGALAYAHRKGVIHRDVKPGNVLLDEDGNAYLSDFGIATRLADHSDTPATTSLGFIPPEELAGQPHTFRSDIFSLGVLAFQVLTGVSPTGRLPLPSLDEVRPGLPPELSWAVAKATAQEPAERFERVEDFLRAARQAAGADVVTVAREGDTTRPAEAIRNPYKGLRAFGETDALDFHGREALVDELLAAVGSNNLVTVVGPSGSGKSSVVRAGLIPALRAGGLPDSRRWLFADMYPGSYPFEELEAALLRVAVDHPSDLLTELLEPHGLLRVTKRILPGDDSILFLVIDQFEELFSAVSSEGTRRRFLDNLASVATDDRSRVRVALTMRADFLNRPLEYGEFAQAIRPGTVMVGPPTREGLSQAVAVPARAVGLDLEPGLVARIVSDVENQPGGLPLLQYALTEMFSRREGERLTIAGYDETGGVLGALGRRAEEIFDGLTESGEEAVRQLFLRLVTVDEAAADTRRRARQTELRSLDVDQEALEGAMRTYGSFRLLSFDRDPVSRGPTVEVAHEALLTEWVRLRGWIDDERESLLLARRLSTATMEWMEAGGDPSFLLRGTRLAQTEGWRETSAVALTAHEEEFLAASVAQRTADEKSARRRRRRAILALTAGLVLVVLLAVVALIQREVAQREAREARARELAGESTLALDEDGERAILIALEAVEVTRRAGEPPMPEAIGALQTAVQSSRLVARVGDVSEAGPLAAPPDGSWFVTGSATSAADLEVIDPVSSARVTLSGPVGREVWWYESTDDGSIVVALYAPASADEFPVYILFDPHSGAEIGRLDVALDVDSIHGEDLSPDGSRIVVSHALGATVWDLATGRETGRLEADFPESSEALWVDDDRLVFASERDGIAFFSVERNGVVETGPAIEAARVVGVSPGHETALVQTDVGYQIFEITTGDTVLELDLVTPLSFGWSPDGTRFGYAGYDPVISVVDLDTGSVRRLPGSNDNVFGLVFLGNERLANRATGEILIWDVSPDGPPELRAIRPESGPPAYHDISPDGSLLATLTRPGDTLELIDIVTGESVATLPGQVTGVLGGLRELSPDFTFYGALDNDDFRAAIHRLPSFEVVAEVDGCQTPVAFSPDNNLVVLGGNLCDGGTEPASRVVEIASGRVTLELPYEFIWSAVFNPAGVHEAGRYLALTDQRTVALYDMATKTRMAELAHADLGGENEAGILTLSFDQHGRYLVGGTAEGRIWALDMIAMVEGATMRDGMVFNRQVHTGAAPAPAITSEGVIASAGFDGVVRLWDMHADEMLAEFRSEMETPFIRFSPDETYLSYPDSGNLVRFYLDPDTLIELAESRLTRDMTYDECLRYRQPETCVVTEESGAA